MDFVARKRAPRLPEFTYTGPFSYFVTFTTFHRTRFFTDQSNIDIVLPCIHNEKAHGGFDIWAYCFMPDHLHLLLHGTEGSDLKKNVKTFKQASGYAARKKLNVSLWQRSYYEHVLRRDEDLNAVALYIFNNPVRAGMVSDFREYRHSGSCVFDIRQL